MQHCELGKRIIISSSKLLTVVQTKNQLAIKRENIYVKSKCILNHCILVHMVILLVRAVIIVHLYHGN